MATKYLEADKVENITYQTPLCYDPLNVLAEVRDKVRALPAADVEPVRHARKIVYYHGENSFSYTCGACAMPIDGKDYYCRSCGARLDESTMGQVNRRDAVNDGEVRNE